MDILDRFKKSFKAAWLGEFIVDADLSVLSYWKVGGRCTLLLKPYDIGALQYCINWLNSEGIRYLFVGYGTNLLFTDSHVNAVVVCVTDGFDGISSDDNRIIVQSGMWVPALARFAMKNSLSGIEHICGIPGSVGGLVCMNGGSLRRSISENIVYVDSIDTKGRVVRRSRSDCKFSYRKSVFQTNNEMVVEVALDLDHSIRASEIRRTMLSILKDRRLKFPRSLPNCGSVFVSDPAMYEEFGPPGKVIENCGLKGLKIGEMQVSSVHSNFIVNLGKGSAEDALQLIEHVKRTVMNETGYLMDVEARYVDEDGRIRRI